MKVISKFGFCLILFSLMIVSCRGDKDVVVDPPGVIVVNPPQLDVNSSVYGIVKDQLGQPVVDAKVTVNGISINDTDENGFFSSGIIKLNEYGSNIKVEKGGYFLGSTFVQPTAGKASYTELVMVQKTLSGTVSGTSGGTITSNGNATIDFPANGIVDADGNAFAGDVAVFSYWYNPSSNATMQEMPGDLRAVNASDEFQQLATYGMMAVELEDGAGQALQLADDAKATLSMPVPDVMSGDAPANIPMWHFDEDSGYWIEEGEATLVAGEYIGEVAHFSFWNCDIPSNFIELSGTITDTNGDLVVNQYFLLTDTQASWGYTYTDSTGFYSLKVPKDEVLTLEMWNYCGDLLFTTTIGPYSVDSTEDLVVAVNVQPIAQLVGTIIDCQNLGITDGYLKVKSLTDGWYNLIPVGSNGSIERNLWNCGNWTDLILTAYDNVNDKISQGLPVTLVAPITDFGTLQACDNNPEFLDYIINGVANSLPDPRVSLSPNGILALSAYDADSNSVYIVFEEILGASTPMNVSVSTQDVAGNFLFANCNNCPDVVMDITELGAVGDFVIGSWSGTIPASGSNPEATVSGSFKAERE